MKPTDARLMMKTPNFETMNRDELAHYIVDHRDTPEGIEARRVFIRRMEEKAKAKGIEFRRPDHSPKQSNNT